MTAAEDFVAEWLDPSPIYLGVQYELMSGAAMLVQAQLAEIERLRDLVRQAHSRVDVDGLAQGFPTCSACDYEYPERVSVHDVLAHVRSLLDPQL